jgi:hypothetical protein
MRWTLYYKDVRVSWDLDTSDPLGAIGEILGLTGDPRLLAGWHHSDVYALVVESFGRPNQSVVSTTMEIGW